MAAAAGHHLPTHPSTSVYTEARDVAAAVVFVARRGVDVGCDRYWSVSSSVLPSLKRFDWHWRQLASARGAAVLLLSMLVSTVVVWPLVLALQN